MLWNYITVACRYFSRNKLLTGIHLVGLSLGMAACILILLYIQQEFRYSNYHSKGDRVFRVLQFSEAGAGRFTTRTPAAITPAMLSDFAEVEVAARLLDDWWLKVGRGDKKGTLDVALGDAALLEMFDIELLQGDRATILANPNSIVITEEVASIFFADVDPIGGVMTAKDGLFAGDLVVTGIIQDMSPNATVAFDVLMSHPTAESPQNFKDRFESWNVTYFTNYIMLRESSDVTAVEARLPEFLINHIGVERASQFSYRLQPVDRIRLYSEQDFGMIGQDPWGAKSNPRTPHGIHRIHRLALVGLIVLIIACFNFINLAIAQSTRRAGEVGLRKVVGAGRGQLVRQFLGESVFLSMSALALAYVLAWLALPGFNAFMQTNLEFGAGHTFTLGLFSLALLVGILSGTYPAFVLSRFEPMTTSRNSSTSRARGPVRSVLVVAQFAISAVLIVLAISVHQQAQFMSQKNLGFDPGLLVGIPVGRYPRVASLETMKHDFGDHPSILSITASDPTPGASNGGGHRRAVRPEGEEQGKWEMQVFDIDDGFFETFGIDVIAGRNLRAEEDREAFLLNETAVRQLGWDREGLDDAIGKRFDIGPRAGHVVGVVADFHSQSLHHPVGAMAMTQRGDYVYAITARMRENDVPGALAHLEEVWGEHILDIPFERWYVDDHLERWYREDTQLKESTTLFSMLAVFIACLGLFGLATHTAVLRTKEIGVRKVLGASAPGIAAMLSAENAKLVLVANVVAWPVAYYVVGQWLEGFAYRIEMGLDMFLLGGAVTMLLALLTVGSQCVQSALRNPTDLLRSE
jgi:putative ABC transport system permease protein